MGKYSKILQSPTPQSQPLAGRPEMVKNNADGFVFALDKWQQLRRFLILGSEGGTYYVNEKEHTTRNVNVVMACIAEDGPRLVSEILEISDAGRAPKNSPAILALVMASIHGDLATKQAAYRSLPKVCRTGTHLFEFIELRKALGGKWGKGMRRAVGGWYTKKQISDVVYQIIKYRNRNGWSHADVLTLAHPNPNSDVLSKVFGWTVKSAIDPASAPQELEGLEDVIDTRLLFRFDEIQKVKTAKEAAKIIRESGLPREAVPTEFLNDKGVWEALLETMPITAMIRNLGKMTEIGVMDEMSDATQKVIGVLTDQERIRKGRVHPLNLLVALKTYASGAGLRSSKTWRPIQQVVDALDEAFYLAFPSVEPMNKRVMIGLDVSGSMTWQNIGGLPITPREATGALALVTAAIEKRYSIMTFSDTFAPFPLSPKARLDTVLKMMEGLNASRTDCALPMQYAMKHKLEVDTFVIMTDNETWSGKQHPVEALKQYRERYVSDARLIVVGMTATGFSIADPADPLMLDVVGFDTATPALITAFGRGDI